MALVLGINLYLCRRRNRTHAAGIKRKKVIHRPASSDIYGGVEGASELTGSVVSGGGRVGEWLHAERRR